MKLSICIFIYFSAFSNQIEHVGTPWRLSICLSQYEKVIYDLDPTPEYNIMVIRSNFAKFQEILEVFHKMLKKYYKIRFVQIVEPDNHGQIIKKYEI